MATRDAVQRPQLVRSLAIMSEYHWMLLRHLHAAVDRRFGHEGVAVLARGLHRYGYYRGEFIRDSPAAIAEGRSALSLVRHWDAAELALASAQGDVEITATEGRVTVSLPVTPGADYFSAHGSLEILDLHWQQVLAGMARGFGEDVAVECSQVGGSPWTITWTQPGSTANPAQQAEDVFASPARYIELGRRTTGLIAALQMYPAMELIDAFDASGEEAVRESAYAYGAERGAAHRQRHLAEGTPLNLKTFGEVIAERDPLEALFAIRGESYFSPGVSHYDCTYCPLADIWAEQGDEGLRLGYLFDMELHRGLLETYHPGAIVRWDALKTRGDAVCRFRFSIPELVTPEEASMLAPASRRARNTDPPSQA
jgi:hypothetical protein